MQSLLLVWHSRAYTRVPICPSRLASTSPHPKVSFPVNWSLHVLPTSVLFLTPFIPHLCPFFSFLIYPYPNHLLKLISKTSGSTLFFLWGSKQLFSVLPIWQLIMTNVLILPALNLHKPVPGQLKSPMRISDEWISTSNGNCFKLKQDRYRLDLQKELLDTRHF